MPELAGPDRIALAWKAVTCTWIETDPSTQAVAGPAVERKVNSAMDDGELVFVNVSGPRLLVHLEHGSTGLGLQRIDCHIRLYRWPRARCARAESFRHAPVVEDGLAVEYEPETANTGER